MRAGLWDTAVFSIRMCSRSCRKVSDGRVNNYFPITLGDTEIQKISSLGLAHMGDAVYELMVRAWLCAHGKETSRGLHAAAVSYVSANAQAAAAGRLQPMLTEEERVVYRRGRNTRVNSVPSRSTIEQYHAATALEALFGYLYLKGRAERLNQLFETIMEGCGDAS